MDWKGPQKPKTYCDNSSLRSYLSPLLSLSLGRDSCGDRILRSCLQKGPATTLANYVLGAATKQLVLSQGQILAVWTLATKLPNSDLNFAVDFWVDFIGLFFSNEKGPKKDTKKSPAKFTQEFVRKIPLGFLQKPFLDNFRKWTWLQGEFVEHPPSWP